MSNESFASNEQTSLLGEPDDRHAESRAPPSTASVHSSGPPAAQPLHPEPVPSYRSTYNPSLAESGEVDTPTTGKSARIYHFVLLTLFFLAVFWLALLSVDQLISVGVGATQGSGFECFAATLLGVAGVALSLLFYSTPSPSDRTLSLLAAAVFFIDMLVISMVDELRRRIGPLPMLCSFGGAAIACLVCSLSESCVGKAKRQLGSERSILEWCGVITQVTGRVILFVLVAVLSANLIFDAADSHVQVGSLFPVDNTYIHLSCTPSGVDGPIVIIESEQSGEDMHGWVQRVDGVKTVCYWDRPGMGLSDNAPSPIGMEQTMAYLEAALEHELPKFRDEKIVLVSHGIGSLYSRVFAKAVGEQLHGLVLIDGTHEEQFYSFETVLHGLREFLRGVAAPLTWRKLGGVFGGLGAEERLFGVLSWYQPRLHKALLQQQVSAKQRSRLDISLATATLSRDLPVLVVSSSEMCQSKEFSRYQRLLLKLTDRVIAWKIIDGPHNLWYDKKAEKELITQVEGFIAYCK